MEIKTTSFWRTFQLVISYFAMICIDEYVLTTMKRFEEFLWILWITQFVAMQYIIWFAKRSRYWKFSHSSLYLVDLFYYVLCLWWILTLSVQYTQWNLSGNTYHVQGIDSFIYMNEKRVNTSASRLSGLKGYMVHQYIYRIFDDKLWVFFKIFNCFLLQYMLWFVVIKNKPLKHISVQFDAYMILVDIKHKASQLIDMHLFWN